MQTIRGSLWQGLARADKLVGFSTLFKPGTDLVMMYHSVGDDTKFGNVSCDRFRRDLDLFVDKFSVVDLTELLQETTNSRRVAITFDDGYENVYTNAYPILKEFDIPATLFLTSGFLNDPNRLHMADRLGIDDPADVTMLDPEQVRKMIEDGLINIGNHTQNHPRLSAIEDPERRHEEIIGAKSALESMFGVEITRFSYPHGSYDRESVDCVRESHDIAVTSINHQLSHDPNPYLLPRIRGHNPRYLLEWELTGLSERFRELYAAGHSK